MLKKRVAELEGQLLSEKSEKALLKNDISDKSKELEKANKSLKDELDKSNSELKLTIKKLNES